MVGNTTRFKLKMLMQGRRRQTPRPYRESQHERYSDGSTLRGGSRTYRGATGTSWPGLPPLPGFLAGQPRHGERPLATFIRRHGRRCHSCRGKAEKCPARLSLREKTGQSPSQPSGLWRRGALAKKAEKCAAQADAALQTAQRERLPEQGQFADVQAFLRELPPDAVSLLSTCYTRTAC